MRLLQHEKNNYLILATLDDLLGLVQAGFTIHGQEGDGFGRPRTAAELIARGKRMWEEEQSSLRNIEWGSPYLFWEGELAGVISTPMAHHSDSDYWSQFHISLQWSHSDGFDRPLPAGALKLIGMAKGREE